VEEKEEERGTGQKRSINVGIPKWFSHVCDKKEGLEQDRRRDVVSLAIECALLFFFCFSA
jgi:hypothetical protein